ncbi:hypothetical protein [Burkholderia cenocepacia]|uniref:hypothetical protein n=1 Tax=Burkholderia cenocepacia TaxID=95486 RepID=UPI002AB7A42D|nr:hypothetical protein [Burkholderia cenocepacia]
MQKSFTFEFDNEVLSLCSDEYLVGCWYAAYELLIVGGNRDAIETVFDIGIEIIDRWMLDQRVPMSNTVARKHLRTRVLRFAGSNGAEGVVAQTGDESYATASAPQTEV